MLQQSCTVPCNVHRVAYTMGVMTFLFFIALIITVITGVCLGDCMLWSFILFCCFALCMALFHKFLHEDDQHERAALLASPSTIDQIDL